MRRIMIVCCGLLIGGCATTDQLAEANAKIQKLETKVARIESDLYEPIREKKVEKQAYRPYQLKNTNSVTRILDETNMIGSFCGYRFGAVAPESYRKQLHGANDHYEDLQTPFRAFKKVQLGYTQVYTRLHTVFLQLTVDEIAADSVEEEVIKIKDIIERKFGVEMTPIKRKPQYKEFSCEYTGRGVQIRLWTNSQSNNGAGFWLKVECPRIIAEDKERATLEAKKFSLPEGEGINVL